MFREKIHYIAYGLAAIAGALFLCPGPVLAMQADGGQSAFNVQKVSPQEAYRQVKSEGALLVCAYDKEEACRKIMLEGAITLKGLEQRLPELKKDQPIIFY